MNTVPSLAIGLLAGAALGGFFFMGLWWTVSRGLGSSAPALWFVPSLLVRTSIVGAGLYAVARDDWRRLLACLIGFLLARFVVMRLTPGPTAPEVNA